MWKFLTPKVRTILKKIIAIFLPIFSVLFIVSTTAVIIVVMKGYSIDINKKEIIKTGVLNIETYPKNAEITVNNEYYGKTNKAIPNLRVGKYSVALYKENYFPYNKEVNIEHGLASPVIAALIRDIDHEQVLEKAEGAIIATTKEAFFIITPPEANRSYTLQKIYSTKSFLDDPAVTKDELMELILPEKTQILSMSIAPQNDTLLFTLSDEKKNRSIAIVQYEEGKTAELSTLNVKALTHYLQNSNTEINWTHDPEYILIETNEQIISYNIVTGTRVILLEKDKDKKYILDSTEKGLVILNTLVKDEELSYDFDYMSYSGAPLLLEIPEITLPYVPTSMWVDAETQSTLIIINTEENAYLIGKLYDTKTGEYNITLGDKMIGDIEILQLNTEFSQIEISTGPISERPIVLRSKHSIVFLANEGKELGLFTYNKRSANAVSKLGYQKIVFSEERMKAISDLLTENYILYIRNGTLFMTDLSGENIYTLENKITDITLSENHTAILYLDSEKNLFFRILQ